MLPTLVLSAALAAGPNPLAAAGEPQATSARAAETTASTTTTASEADEKPTAAAQWWETMEYLLWWNRNARVPPLATRTRNGTLPVLGNPSTVGVFGGAPLDTPDQSGGRFSIGLPASKDDIISFEGNYFFIGSRTTNCLAHSTGTVAAPAIGLPYVDAYVGTPAVETVASPLTGSGALILSNSARLQGCELNTLFELWFGDGFEVHGLFGFRYLEVDEGLLLQRISEFGNDPLGLGLRRLSSADQFDGHNRFYGGQVGLKASWTLGPVFIEGVAKLGLGDVEEVVRINGATQLQGPAIDARVGGGLFALPTNSGRHSRDVFGMVPEGTLRIGLAGSAHSRVFVGYNLLYLTEAARPGDQIDRVLNAGQFPMNGGSASGPDRPGFDFHRSDFWAQGLIIGMEWRY